jgi:hypothetical protein
MSSLSYDIYLRATPQQIRSVMETGEPLEFRIGG